MKQLGFLFDADLCIGCRTCESACKNENHTPEGVNWRRVTSAPQDGFLSISCNHCDSPECFRVCPQKSYTKRRDGIVMIDNNRCDGCMDCVSACPYGTPQFDAQLHKASKCNLCYTRLQQGLQPACIEACPTGALQLIDLNRKLPEGSVPTIPGFPDTVLTRPSTRFRPVQPRKRYWIKKV